MLTMNSKIVDLTTKHTRRDHRHRSGQSLVLMVILLPIICGIIGLILDSGALMLESRHCQQVADSAATAAATEIRLGNSFSDASTAAQNEVNIYNELSQANVTLNIPPVNGAFAGKANHAEVVLERPVQMNLIQFLTGKSTEKVRVRSVASYNDVTDESAIVVLDEDPSSFSVDPISLSVALPSLPSLLGGLEVLGIGQVKVNGAVLVNNKWGGVDENGNDVGEADGPPYAISGTPLLNSTKLLAKDIRVSGGVDNPNNYGNYTAGKSSPLRANKLPVPDPLKNLPVPTTSTDPTNVKVTNYGAKTILTLPFITTTLSPGVYEYINVVAGNVVFEPGVYIIRSQEPVTKSALRLLAGTVTANGVMFYITDNAAYSASGGNVDESDGQTEPASPAVATLTPSVVINIGLLGSTFSPLSSAGSPYDGMMFFQRRHDRRPVILVQENLIGNGTIHGRIYSKWGHVIFAGKGTYDVAVAAGTIRLIALLDMTINPSNPFPAAKDVKLVE